MSNMEGGAGGGMFLQKTFVDSSTHEGFEISKNCKMSKSSRFTKILPEMKPTARQNGAKHTFFSLRFSTYSKGGEGYLGG